MAFKSPYQLIKISTLTATSSATLSFTSAISSSFSTYKVQIRNLIPSDDATTMTLVMSTDNGATYLNSNYQWTYRTMTSGNSDAFARSAADSSVTLNDLTSNTASSGIYSDMFFYNLNSGVQKPICNSQIIYKNSAGVLNLLLGAGGNSTTTAVNAIKFLISAGTFASGTITLFGVNDS